MSDEPTRPSEATRGARAATAVLGHVCEHAGCGKDAGWGFARPKRPSHWFCYEHRGDEEAFL
ncbi:hypothetical protein ACVOMV_25080 [Mesorhizobium atlanticum]